MTLLVVGLQQRSTDLDFFGRTAISSEALPKVLHALVECDDIRQAAVLSTCMRTEFYVEVERYHAALAQISDVVAVYTGLATEAVGEHLYTFYDDAAGQHLFEVAAGLDSAVLGEGEILHQVRGAWTAAVEANTVGGALDRVLRHAVEVGKRVRSETAIARGTTSIAESAVDLAQLNGVHIETAKVVVVGAGEMASGVVRALAHRGATDITVTNRTAKRATELAESYAAKAVPFDTLSAVASQADFVVSSTSSQHPLLHPEDFDHPHSGSSRLILDAGVPRDVDPMVADHANVTLLTIDDLRMHAEQGRSARTTEADAARMIIDEELQRYADIQRGRLAAPVVTALRQRADEVRERELERFAARLATMTSEQRAMVDGLTSAMLNKLLHEPTMQLKASAGTDEGDRMADALREAFGLES